MTGMGCMSNTDRDCVLFSNSRIVETYDPDNEVAICATLFSGLLQL